MKSWIGWLLMGFLTATAVTISWVQRPSETRDRAKIESMVQDYYSSLRRNDFDRAAGFYAPAVGLLVSATGHNMPDVLKAVSSLSAEGIPEVVELDALRFDGKHTGRAVGELIVPGPREPGVGNFIVSDGKTGEKKGTWARTLHFVKIGREWKISPESSSSVGSNPGKALEMLQRLSKSTQEPKKAYSYTGGENPVDVPAAAVAPSLR